MRNNSSPGFQKRSKELEMLFENSFDALLLTGMDGKIYRANSAAEELFGYSAEELCQLGRMGLADMTDPAWPKAIEERNTTGKFIGVLRCRKKDGTQFYCEVASRTFKSGDGSLMTSTSVRDVTSRIESEEELRAAHKQMQDIIDGSPAIIFAKNLQGRFILANKKLEELFGMTNEEIKGKTDFDFLPQKWAEYFRAQDSEAAKSRKSIEIIEESDFPDGVNHYYYLNKFPLLDENARPYAICGIATDITEQMDAEDVIRRERELFEGIFNSIPVMVTTYDPKLKTFRLNKELKSHLGWTEEDTLDGNFMEKVYPDPILRKEVSDFMKSLEPGWREFLVTAKDGSRFESSWSNVWLTDNTHIGIGLDISRNKETERQLRESRQGLIEAQRLAHMGSFTFDASTGMLDWMDEVFNIFERDPDKGHPSLQDVMNYVHPDDREYVDACLDEAQKDKKTLSMEYRIVTDNGNVKYLRYIGNPIFDSNGNLVKRFGTVLDITENKEAELKLKTTLENLERSNRELEQFAYIASHDLQEPLRMVSNFARLLAQRYQDHLDDNANEFIAFMVEGTKRMQNLISDLLQYARVTTKAQPFEATDMTQIMDYVTADLRMAIDEKNAYLNYGKLPEIMADPIQMRQLMQNLVANAIKFKGNKDPEISIEARSNEKEWVFCVRDNGIGIAPEYHDRIFIIFQRLHEREKYAGTGIGLALCKKIVERHGGRIWVESEERQGAAFYFTIPFVSLQF
ncbi:MAG: PAS domain S-box protein [Acidobacteriota bacterium]